MFKAEGGSSEDVAAAKSAIMSFKVDELKRCLGRVGLTKQGRKADLVVRLVRYMETRPASLSSLIHVVNEIASGGSAPVARRVAASVPAPPPPEDQSDGQIRCVCGDPRSDGLMIQCETCEVWQHVNCLGIQPQDVDGIQEYLCELCRSKDLNPFTEGTQVTRSACIPALKLGVQRPVSIHLHLTGEQVHEIRSKSNQPNAAKVLLRSFQANPPYKNHRWPLSCSVAVNNRGVMIKQHPPVWDNVTNTYKHRNLDEVLDISSFVHVGDNKVDIMGHDSNSFLGVLCLVKCIPLLELQRRIKMGRTLDRQRAVSKVAATFSQDGDGDDDDDLLEVAVMLNLKCPLSRTRIKVPARSEKCKHLECFDLNNFLECQHVARFPKWQCPLCNTNSKPHLLVVDSWLDQVLQETQAADLEEVEINKDGSWVPPRPKPVSSKRKQSAVVEPAHNNTHHEDSQKCSRLDNGVQELASEGEEPKEEEEEDAMLQSGLEEDPICLDSD